MVLRPAVKADLIRRVPLFARCSRDEIARVAAIAEERNLETGTEVIRAGEEAREFFVIVEGAVEVHRRGSKRSTIGIGGVFGELAILTEKSRTATVTAVTPLDILVIGRESFLALLAENPSIAGGIAQVLAGRLAADADLDTAVAAEPALRA
jgi:CRP-like cAMP-binding protein